MQGCSPNGDRFLRENGYDFIKKITGATILWSDQDKNQILTLFPVIVQDIVLKDRPELANYWITAEMNQQAI